ncbi:hypothetical protein NODU109028_19500 [Nocardioides dubius]|uniref:Uncharacterized protein n=1 Tax=Nocardioides dubius TaxID=317019 RepID=A0ABN1TKG0_9ACTN
MSAKPDLFDTIHAELDEDHVYVHPAMRKHLSAAEEETLSQELTALPEPTYVVLFPYEYDDRFGGKPGDLLTLLHQAHPEPGLYLSNSVAVIPDSYSSVRVEGRQWDIEGERNGEMDYYVTSLVRAAEPQTVQAALSETVELLGLPPEEFNELYRAHEDAEEATREERYGDDDYDDGTSPVLIGSLIVAGLVVGAVALRVLRSKRAKSAALSLPPSAMARVRAANERTLRARAQSETLALGEALDAYEIGSGDNRGSWQQALDHYQAARRLTDEQDAPLLDVVGAIVLAGRGSTALDRALAGKAWAPKPGCFLNPLHGHGNTGRPVLLAGRSTAVPLCERCRRDLERGNVPEILDVLDDDKPQHYFDTHLEPWASTGFGSLEPDLLAAMRRRSER